MSGYSLWLSPPSTSSLTPLIARLAQENGTESFAPHATLVSDDIVPSGLTVDEVKEKVELGVTVWREKQGEEKLSLKYKDVRQGDAYYQCILAALHLSSALLSLHHSIVSSFSLPSPPKTVYFPHLSLVYGDLTPSNKSSIVEGLEEEGAVTKREEGVAIEGEDGFEPSEILLVRTQGKCETWEVVERIAL